MMLVRRRRRERALALGRYFICSIASSTRARVSSETCLRRAWLLLRTLETVIMLTPARAATSLMVTAFLSAMLSSVPARLHAAPAVQSQPCRKREGQCARQQFSLRPAMFIVKHDGS